jgi:hypothetical protein
MHTLPCVLVPGIGGAELKNSILPGIYTEYSCEIEFLQHGNREITEFHCFFQVWRA